MIYEYIFIYVWIEFVIKISKYIGAREPVYFYSFKS